MHGRGDDDELRQLAVNRKISALASGEWPLPDLSGGGGGDGKDAKVGPAAEAGAATEKVGLDRGEDLVQGGGSGPARAGSARARRTQIRDALLVGTQSNLLCYDVEQNSDLFYKEVPEGLNAIAFGTIPQQKDPLAIVGGNCSLQGFDCKGNEMFWTVTGDNVTALAFRGKQLIVGSEDYEIRVFEGEDIVTEVTETDVVVKLAHVQGKRFVFGLANGAIGVYDDANRVWHARAKHEVMDIAVYDLDNDGEPEIITGWSNGRLEVRNQDSGQLVFKDRYSSPVSGICVADYRMQGAEEIICCSANGEVRGYLAATTEEVKEEIQDKMDDSKLEALKAKKMALMLELMGYERNIEALNANKGKAVGAGVVSSDTRLDIDVVPNATDRRLELRLSSDEGTVIKLAVLVCPALFPNGSFAVKPAKPADRIAFPVDLSRQSAAAEVEIQTVVGHLSSEQDHVFQNKVTLARFCQYRLLPEKSAAEVPESTVEFELNERIKSVVNFVRDGFGAECKEPSSGNKVEFTFSGVADGSILVMKYSEASDNAKGRMQLRTDDLELAGELVQAIVDSFELKTLESVANFPKQMADFKKTMELVDDLNATRRRLQADIADNSNLVKSLVVKAEDARRLGNMETMKRMYSQLYELNQDLMDEYKKRANNRAELVKNLQVVNQMIQKTSKLRAGAPKAAVVAGCRKALKANNIHALFDIFKFGKESAK